MKSFRAHTSFIPESVVNSPSMEIPIPVILPQTEYEAIDTNQAFGIYVKIYTSKEQVGTENYRKIYLSPEEIKQYGEAQNKLTIGELRHILIGISFADSCINFNWGWEITEVHGAGYNNEYNPLESTLISGFLINTTFTRPDTNTGVIGIGKGRRMWIEETASETSVVMTAWVCVELIIKHEAMEAMKYRGAKILNPHKTLPELAYPEKMK